MTIEEAVESLAKHLGDVPIFWVRHVDGVIIVDVHYIHRVKEVTDLGGIWEGYPVRVAHRSCW